MPIATFSTSAPNQVAASNTAGIQIGDDATDKVGFFGATPTARRSRAAQAAVARGLANASVVTFDTTQSPTAVDPNTTAEKAMTVTGVLTGDIVTVNKPTAQAGLIVSQFARVSVANTIQVCMGNLTAATITPTATQHYSVAVFRGFPAVTATLSPTAVAAATNSEQTFAVAGIHAGETVIAVKPTTQAGIIVSGARAVADGSVAITFSNLTGSTVTPTAAQVYTFISTPGLEAADNRVIECVNGGTITGVATITTAEREILVTDLLANDTIVGVSKPTHQAGLGLSNWRVSAAGSMGLGYVNPTAATVTPTAGELYCVAIHRHAPAAPVKSYTPTLTPASVAANTSAEQTFTVAGLVAGSTVAINKPSMTTGLVATSARVSALDTLAVTFGNLTAAAIVPPTEVYSVANVQQVPTAGAATINTWISQGVSVGEVGTTAQANELASALTEKGFVAGS